MKDRLGREIEYVRISVTRNCNLKCVYCDSGDETMERSCNSGLTSREIKMVIAAMADLGITKVRITGGEPLLRSDIIDIVRCVAGIRGIADILMTTNGIHLSQLAPELKKAGLKRINISLDSLQPQRFQSITGGGNLDAVLDGIDEALRCGLTPVKINTVLVKGMNDDEIDNFIQFAQNHPVEVRFIELMPIGQFGQQNRDKGISNQDIIRTHPGLIKCDTDTQNGVAEYYHAEGFQGRVGFISPMSHQFCHCCNKIRLTCDGRIKPCLGNNGEADLLDVLRNHPQDLTEFIRQVVYEKPTGHDFSGGYCSKRTMKGIGG